MILSFLISKSFFLVIVAICCNLFRLSGQELLVSPLIKNEHAQDIAFYNFWEDQKGFLWIGSNHGVFRYDGQELLNYTKKDSLDFHNVLNIVEDKNGGIWLVTFQKGLIFFDYSTNELHIPKWNKKLQQLLNKRWVSNLFIAADSTIWLQKFAYTTDSIVEFFKIRNNHITTHSISRTTKLNLFFDKHRFSPKQQLLFKTVQAQLTKTKDSLNPSDLVGMLKRLGKNNMVSYNSLFPYRNPNYILRKLVLTTSSSLLGLGYNGFTISPFSSTTPTLLSKYQINDIYKLSDGQYLFSTNQNGILKSSSLAIKEYTSKSIDSPISNIHVADDYLYIKTQKSIYKKHLSSSNLEFILSINPNYEGVNFLRTFVVWHNTIVLNNLAFYQNQQQQLFPLTIRNRLKGRSKSIQVIKDSLLLMTSANGFVLVDKNWEVVTDSKDLGYQSWTHTAQLVDSNKIWLGTNTGIIEYDCLAQQLTPVALPIQELVVKVIKGNKKTGIVVGTQRNGVFIFPPNQPFRAIAKNHQLSSNHVKSILLANDSTAWVGTDKGIDKITFSNNSASVQVANYLSGFFISHLALLGDTVFAINNGKLIYFPQNILPLNAKTSITSIIGLSVNGKSKTSKNGLIELLRHENNIQLFYRKPNFRAATPDTFVYALLSEKETDTLWKQTTDFSMSFLLNPGQYTFLVTTKAELNLTTPQFQKLTICIQKHFRDTIYFSLLLYLLFILGISGIAYIVVRSIKLQKALVESQLKLLRTQMNPHFLFNTLNSITGHIAAQNTWESIRYISKFSKLVRNILKSSKESFLPLDDELKILEDYIHLEKMRLGERYTIDLVPPVYKSLTTFYIPPMLIQPFIENAIIHGLAPKKEGKISILFEQVQDNILSIIVQDNGIGRKATKAKRANLNFKLNESIGIANVEKRIAIINKTYKINIRLNIEDLYATTGEALGTKVQIFIPLFDYNANTVKLL